MAEPLRVGLSCVYIRAILNLVNHQSANSAKVQVGLCAKCRFMRLVESDRGSTFYFCQRSLTDDSYPKYPRLPVLQCRGYEPVADGE